MCLHNGPILRCWRKRHTVYQNVSKWYEIIHNIYYSLIVCNAFVRLLFTVIASDFDETKISMARQNSTIYGCRDKIEFKVQDYFSIVGQHADIVFMSPPWGGPEYLAREVYSFSSMCEANGGGENIAKIARSIAPKLVLHLPRTIDKKEVCCAKYCTL